MVKIQDAEWTTVAQMWWAFVWRVLVIGTMLALGQWDEFRMHVRAALTGIAAR